MTYEEKGILIKYVDALNQDYVRHLALNVGLTPNEYKRKLLRDVYDIKCLSKHKLYILVSRLDAMEDEEISRLEKVNHMSITQIKKKVKGDLSSGKM